MPDPIWTNKGHEVYESRCLKQLKKFPDNYFDSCITDPPYGLSFMGKKWDYDIPKTRVWEEVLRVLKPGAYLLAFGGSRTFHRIWCSIEDAGFEIRDTIMWVYGSGFPKSLNVSKAIDKAAGVKPIDLGQSPNWRESKKDREKNGSMEVRGENAGRLTAPATDAAKQWAGWGTALKPAHEPIVVARKPLIGTIAENVQRYGTGAINVDGCRVPGKLEGDPNRFSKAYSQGDGHEGWKRKAHDTYSAPVVRQEGRFPANLIHDGSDEVLDLFPDVSSGALTPAQPKNGGFAGTKNCYGSAKTGGNNNYESNSGSAARFFYTAKASKSDRGADNTHPTVKPISLMSYLCKLVSPKECKVLDPFMGSGTTGIAAILNDCYFTGIDMDEKYVQIAIKRLTKAIRKRASTFGL